jgi:hypothetical protein
MNETEIQELRARFRGEWHGHRSREAESSACLKTFRAHCSQA